jgi:hypothetical protein
MSHPLPPYKIVVAFVVVFVFLSGVLRLSSPVRRHGLPHCASSCMFHRLQTLSSLFSNRKQLTPQHAIDEVNKRGPGPLPPLTV